MLDFVIDSSAEGGKKKRWIQREGRRGAHVGKERLEAAKRLVIRDDAVGATKGEDERDVGRSRASVLIDGHLVGVIGTGGISRRVRKGGCAVQVAIPFRARLHVGQLLP